MSVKTIKLTTAEAIVRYLIAQRIEIDGQNLPLFPGVMGIFGHGNVTSLGHSLEMHRKELPVWRGQNEQGMGLAAAAFAKAKRRQQILVATSSTGSSAAAGRALWHPIDYRQRFIPFGLQILGPHYSPGPDPKLATAGGCDHVRSSRLRFL